MFRLYALMLGAGLACVAQAGQAAVPQPGSDFAARIAALEADVAQLQAQPGPAAPRSLFQPRLWDLYGGGWYGGAEATILEPFMSGAPS